MLVNSYLFKLLGFSTKQERYLDSYDKFHIRKETLKQY